MPGGLGVSPKLNKKVAQAKRRATRAPPEAATHLNLTHHPYQVWVRDLPAKNCRTCCPSWSASQSA
jgi:hypothetical protein